MNETRLVENLVVAGPLSRRRRDVLKPLAAAALAAAVPAARAQPRPERRGPLKVAFVYVGPIADSGWTFQHDLGRRELEQALAGRVETRFVEKVPEGPDAERVIRDLASQGQQVIFAASFGYMEPMARVAREFPDTVFEHCSGYRTAPNLATYNARFYEGRYLAGLVAGRSTKSNVLGYVAGFPIPEVLQGINAYAIGARSVNPRAEVRVVWTSDWFDPGRERDAALTLVNQGADVLAYHTGSAGVPQAAEARGVGLIGYHSDMSRIAPKAALVSVTHHWGRYCTQRVQAVLDGTWRTQSVWGGLKDGMIRVDPIGAQVPREVVELVRARERDIVAGRLHPFAGPLRDNEGRVRLAQGAMADEDLNRIDWFVDGVAGRVPKG